MEYHVSKQGNDFNVGSLKEPFLTISKAAKVADESDTVIVHEGEYREWVIIDKGAKNHVRRITFKAADGEKAVIKGSEIVENWEKYSGDVYKAVVPNSLFGEYNPYEELVKGDWLWPRDYKVHTGQVYLSGKALIEASGIDNMQPYSWHAKVTENGTEIYANFGGENPFDNIIEINVRRACFTASSPGVNYITLSGFEICHAATQWSPPTSDQTGMVCANMCKGWIIENNHIHDARCSGICIGKDRSSGHIYLTRNERKVGHVNQIESVFLAAAGLWDKDLIGGHIIRNNTIHDMGQTGIVGHMGCAFSEVYNNHIYNIRLVDEFEGDEIGGIKFHAAIDTCIHNNNIHDCYRGLWLDWQTQGTRVSSNLFFNNDIAQDLMIEVSHGPFMVDNNILCSKNNLEDVSQGGAYVHNLFFGMERTSDTARYTPYHFAHSTKVKGMVHIFTGDNRIYNNIYINKDVETEEGYKCGTGAFDGYNVSLEAYLENCGGKTDASSRDNIKLPVYINNNCYFAGAKAFDGEETNVVSDVSPEVKIVEENGNYYLIFDADNNIFELDTQVINTDNLAVTFFGEDIFETAQETKLVIDHDFLGNERSERPTPGPIENLQPGKQKILVWKKN